MAVTRKSFLLLAAFLITVIGCERPNDADFSLEQSLQAPVLLQKEYQFLGGPNALIDSTSEQFDSLFTVESDGLVTLSKDEPIDFGNLDDALPTITASPTNVDAKVGPIVLDDLSSQSDDGNLGSASFQQITGNNSDLQQGDNLPGGSTPAPVNIDLDTDYFVSATISNGSIKVKVDNELGFDLSSLTVTLKSGTNSVGSNTINSLNDTREDSLTYPIAQGTVLQDLNVDVSAQWNTQTMNRDAGQLIIRDTNGNPDDPANQLTASRVEAVVSPQDFTSSGQSDVSDEDFEFTASDHYVAFNGGRIRIVNIANNIDVDIDTLRISFPGIRTSPFGVGDSLVVEFSGSSSIDANDTNVADKTVDLDGMRLFANDNTIDFNVFGITKDTQQGTGSQARVIRQSDNFTADIRFRETTIAEAFGKILTRNIFLNQDDPANGEGAVDLFNADEVEITNIDGLSELSGQLDGLDFENPTLTIKYRSNVGVKSQIIAAILGSDSKGNRVFLRPNAGSSFDVSSAEAPNSLKNNGDDILADNMVQFPVPKSTGGTISGSVEFTRDNSNVREFVNNLPSTIRFVGIDELNRQEEIGTIKDPVRFDPDMSLNIPLNITAVNATFNDTSESDLGNLPNPDEDDQRLIEGVVTIEYLNKLPFDMGLTLRFVDQNDVEVTSVPLPTENELRINPAPIDQATRFVTQGNDGKLEVSLGTEQLDVLFRTRKILIDIDFNTTAKERVRIRAEDSISLDIKLNVKLQSTIN